MAKKLRLDGRASFMSPLTYHQGVFKGQVISIRDEDAAKLLLLKDEAGTAIFTEVTTAATYDLTVKYPDAVNVVARSGKLFTDDPNTPKTDLVELPITSGSSGGSTGGGGAGSSTGPNIVDLVIFAGQSQSNSNGTTGSDVPTNLQAAMSNAFIWDPWANEWLNYQAGVNSAIHLQSGKYPNTTQYWGFEAEYLRRYTALYTDKKVFAIKLGFSSTSIDQAARTAQRGCWDPALRNELYDYLVRAINTARDNLHAQGYSVRVRGIHWIQGENEAGVNTPATNYGTTLANFLAALRRDTGLATAPFIISRINKNWTYASSVRAGQTTVAEATPGARIVYVDDLPLAADNTHYNPVGVVEGGKRHFYAGTTAAEAYAAYAAKLSFTPNNRQKAALMQFFQGLIERSLYSMLEVLQLYFMPDQASALVNAMPYNYNASNAGMTFTAKAGFTGVSSTSYINTGVLPSATALLKQDDISLSMYVGNEVTSTGADMGAYVGTATDVLAINPAASSNFRINHTAVNANNTFTAGATVAGLWTMQRDAAAVSSVRQNGVQLQADTTNTSGTPPTVPVFVGNRSASANSGTSGTVGRLYQAFAAGSARTVAQEAALSSLLATLIANFTAA